ncbi:MAG: putative short-subunit dehydrogenase-like oxidoreductase (DUF2520 family) [Granulosicoccus sp.]|jgi:predicted short-subunit dehydrogenase-like oxidoreductase (DUF2520 family)
MSKELKIILIGAGNVGFHLGKKLHEIGLEIEQVYSRKITKAKRLGKIIKCEAIQNLDDISTEADLYILAVPDSAIEKVAADLSTRIPSSKLVVHTSGATPSMVLKPYFKNYGIFYPLQTFSIGREVDFANIPICIDSNLKKHRILLEKLGKRISQNVHQINDRERAILHVAAVFVNNFSNNLFTIGEKITSTEHLPFDILKPLIKETVDKITQHAPSEMQTGPAKRGDEITIQLHLKYLEKNFPEFIEVYQTMTQNINTKFSKKLS